MAKQSFMITLTALLFLPGQLQAFQCEVTKEVDLVFVMDGSQSIGSSNFELSKQFVQDVADRFTIGSGAGETRFGVVQFSEPPATVEIDLSLGDRDSRFSQLLSGIVYQSGANTFIGDGINAGSDMLVASHRAGAQKVIVVLTDGVSTDAGDVAAENARANGIAVMSVGIGTGINEQELNDIADEPDYVFTVGDYDELVNTVENFYDETCTIIQELPEVLECKVMSEVDFVFVLDGSVSIRSSNFDLSKQFVQDVVDHFNLGEDAGESRFGVVQFSTENSAIMEISLGMGDDITRFSDALPNVVYQNGPGTYIGQGIDEAANMLIGSKRQAQQVIIVMTDGQSADDGSAAADRARQSGIQVMSVGVGPMISQSELQAIADQPDYVFTVNDYTELVDTAQQFYTQTCFILEGIPVAGDCTQCVNQFVADQGCECFADTSCDVDALVSSECEMCVFEAIQECGLSFTTPDLGTMMPTAAPVQITTTTTSSTPACIVTDAVDLVFVVDGSGSVVAQNFELTKNFLLDVTDRFTIGSDLGETRFGIVQFSAQGMTTREIDVADGDSSSAVTSAITNMVYQQGGSTYIGEAITVATEMLNTQARASAHQVLVVLTDGVSFDDAELAANDARSAGIAVMTVGVGGVIDQNELQDMADEDHYVFTVTSFDELVNAVHDFYTETCEIIQTLNLTSIDCCRTGSYGTEWADVECRKHNTYAECVADRGAKCNYGLAWDDMGFFQVPIPGCATVPTPNPTPAPTVSHAAATCPFGYHQVGSLSTNNDIGGYGMASRQEAYTFRTFGQCHEMCEMTVGCVAFNWNEAGMCVWYDSSEPNRDDGRGFIFCARGSYPSAMPTTEAPTLSPTDLTSIPYDGPAYYCHSYLDPHVDTWHVAGNRHPEKLDIGVKSASPLSSHTGDWVYLEYGVYKVTLTHHEESTYNTRVYIHKDDNLIYSFNGESGERVTNVNEIDMISDPLNCGAICQSHRFFVDYAGVVGWEYENVKLKNIPLRVLILQDTQKRTIGGGEIQIVAFEWTERPTILSGVCGASQSDYRMYQIGHNTIGRRELVDAETESCPTLNQCCGRLAATFNNFESCQLDNYVSCCNDSGADSNNCCGDWIHQVPYCTADSCNRGEACNPIDGYCYPENEIAVLTAYQGSCQSVIDLNIDLDVCWMASGKLSCQQIIDTNECDSGIAYLSRTIGGNGEVAMYDDCRFMWYAEYSCNAPVLSCPAGYIQAGALGSDIGGCGLEGCLDHIQTIEQCESRCEATENCYAFTFARPLEEKDNAFSCTLYDSVVPTGIDGNKIFCKSLNAPVVGTVAFEIKLERKSACEDSVGTLKQVVARTAGVELRHVTATATNCAMGDFKITIDVESADHVDPLQEQVDSDLFYQRLSNELKNQGENIDKATTPVNLSTQNQKDDTSTSTLIVIIVVLVFIVLVLVLYIAYIKVSGWTEEDVTDPEMGDKRVPEVISGHQKLPVEGASTLHENDSGLLKTTLGAESLRF